MVALHPTKPRPKTARRIGCVALALICLFGGCIGWPVVRIRIARQRVDKWCASAPEVGSAVQLQSLAANARANGLKVIGPVAQPSGQVLLAYDNWMMARYFCDMTIVEGRMAAKRVSFLD